MHPWVARAFLRRMLDNGKVIAYRNLEVQELPSGRLLSASEIVRWAQIEVKPLTQIEVDTMEDLRKRFEKEVLWKQHQIEDKNHDTICSGTPVGQWCKCKKLQEELHQFEEYAMAHYVKPKPPKNDETKADSLLSKKAAQPEFAH